MDQDQTAPTGAVRAWYTLFVEGASKTIQQTTKQSSFIVIGALRVKINIEMS